MINILLVIVGLLFSSPAQAGCGQGNPNCIVPTVPTCVVDNRAASTAYVNNCSGGGGGAVSSVSNSDGTLTISPTTGVVIASIALGHANTWTATQTFSNIIDSAIAGGGTQCVQVSNTGLLSGTGLACGSGSSAVTSVSNSDGTLTISPTTGAVIASIALGHANTWTAQQIINKNATPSGGITTFAFYTTGAFGGGIGLLDTGEIGLWSSGNGTQFNIGFGANSASALTTIGLFSNSSSQGDAAFKLTPTASSLVFGLDVIQSLAGTPSGGFGNCANCISAVTTMNLIDITSDNVGADPSVGTNGIFGLTISQRVGGANVTGERSNFYTSMQLTSQDKQSGTGSSFCPCYLGMVNEVFSGVQDGGTGTGNGQSRGQEFAWNPRVGLKTGATNWDQVAIAEMDLEVDTGASVGDKYGLLFVLQPGDAVQGTRRDFAYGIGNAGHVGWRMGFIATDIFGAPFSTNATFIGTDFVNGVSHTIQTGIDLTGFIINGSMIKGGANAGQPTFIVSGTGDIVGQSYNIIAGGVLTNGATCSGTPTAGFTVTHGIVVAC